MDKWSIVGAIMILVGLVVLFLLWGFIVTIVVTLLKLIAVAIGIVLVLGGVAMVLFGARWRRRRVSWGQSPAST